jgi:hypothetical protein
MSYIQLAEGHRDDAGGPWDEGSWHGVRFRRRFRVPYSVFDDLCSEYAKTDQRKQTDRYGRPRCELKILILGALRVLGQAATFDVIDEATNISFQTHNSFFKKFVEWVSTSLFDEYVNLPTGFEEVQHIEDYYKRLGVPGCTGSVDCVHWGWDMCPAGLQSDCKGKEGFPTVVFQVIVSHTRKILAVSNVFYGTWNDITITHLDKNVEKIQTGELSNYKWSREQEDGTVAEETGLFLICDGGYPKRPLLICPFKDQQEGSDMYTWSKHIESLRKDVECTFGILKKRFMILKHACRLHNIEDMERIFRTCCVLHNILLARDGRDNWERLLEDDENVDNTDLLHYAAPVSNNHSFARGERRTYQDREASSAGEDAFVSHTANEAFTARREDLIAHFNVLCERREIELL